MDISLMIEGQMGLTWPRWQRVVAEAEDLGFAGIFRSDHFINPNPPDSDSLEMIVSLTYLASHTKHVHFGPLVAPLLRPAAGVQRSWDGRDHGAVA